MPRPDLLAIFRAGFVRRWHTNPDLSHTCDRIDGHSARVARIILALHPNPSLALIRAALVHDDGESVTGDVPHTLKAQCGETWGDAMDRTEYLAGVDLWGHWQQPLGDEDLDWLKFADRLDAYMWAAHHAPHLMDQDGWPQARLWLEGSGVSVLRPYCVGRQRTVKGLLSKFSWRAESVWN